MRAPADDYNHRVALAIRDVLVTLMDAAVHFLFARNDSGRRALRRASRKLTTLIVQIDQAMGGRR
jgi:hypothetical protein